MREGVVAVVPLLALGGDRVEAGVDDAQRVDAHRLGRRRQERLGAADLNPIGPVRRDDVGLQRVRDGGVHHDGVDVDHRADRVEVHGRALLRDRHGEHRVGKLAREHAVRECLHPGGRGPLTDADRDDTGPEQQHVAAFEPGLVVVAAAVEPADAPANRGWCR